MATDNQSDNYWQLVYDDNAAVQHVAGIWEGNKKEPYMLCHNGNGDNNSSQREWGKHIEEYEH